MSRQAPYCFGQCHSKEDCKECEFTKECRERLFGSLNTGSGKVEE
jgi:hypothetical protein